MGVGEGCCAGCEQGGEEELHGGRCECVLLDVDGLWTKIVSERAPVLSNESTRA